MIHIHRSETPDFFVCLWIFILLYFYIVFGFLILFLLGNRFREERDTGFDLISFEILC